MMQELHMLQQQIYDYQRSIQGLQVQIWEKQQQAYQQAAKNNNNRDMQIERDFLNCQNENQIDEQRDAKNKATIMLGNHSEKRKLEDLYTKTVGNKEFLIIELKEGQQKFNLEYNVNEEKLVNITNWNQSFIQDDQPFSNTINNFKP